MKKTELMDYLYLKSDDINNVEVIEKIICLAIIQECDIKQVNKIMKRIVEYKDLLNAK